MRFPSMNKKPERSVIIPELSGGINTRDSVSLIKDNQLTECTNMWHKDGLLKTRPAFDINSSIIEPMYYGCEFKYKAWPIYKRYGGINYVLVTATTTFLDDMHILPFLVSEENIISIPVIKIGGRSHFLAQHKGEIYLFVEATTLVYSVDERTTNVYKLSSTNVFERVSDDDLYIPKVITHGIPNENGDVNGTQFENYNLLGRKFKVIMSTVNPALDTTTMRYNIPGGAYQAKAGETIKAIINYKDGSEVIHEITFDSATNYRYGICEDSPAEDGRYMYICSAGNLKTGVGFLSKKPDGRVVEYATLSANEYVEDNLELTLLHSQSNDNLAKMTEAEWFGGNALGTRLFVCGNTTEENKSLVMWSDFDKPLYFPVDCNAYVGNTDGAVTGFGKQGEIMVIFKENETHYTYYAQNTEIDSTDFTENGMYDITVSSAYFPLVQLHTNIGCDLPSTIQLCRNRLVWANSDGKIYTLVTINQYNERNIYSISEMIENKIKANGNVNNAVAVDWEGHYMLFSKKNAYLMDYNSYGYQYISSYSKNEDANINIPWYCWVLSDNEPNVATIIDNNLLVISIRHIGTVEHQPVMAFVVRATNESLLGDTEYVWPSIEQKKSEKIPCGVTTKFFDFSAPNHRKNVCSVGLSLVNNGGTPVRAVFVTDAGSDETEILLDDNVQFKSPEYIKSVVINPSVRAITRFGIKFECDSQMGIEGITLNYRLLGGAR